MKIKLLMLFICISTLSLSQSIQRKVVENPLKLREVFVTSTESEFDPMDIFGILNFLMQKNSSGKYNYEIVNIPWAHIEKAINGEHGYIANFTCPNGTVAFSWTQKENDKKVLSHISLYGLYNDKLRQFHGIFDGQYFKNLKTLVIHSTLTTSLNLSDNLNLEYLSCSRNELKTIDLSKNLNLKYLTISENKISSLDISKNLNLKELFLPSNELTSIDVSKNLNLTYLECGYNHLTNIDLTKNLNLHTFYCRDNQLKKIDLSNNVNLLEIDFSNNQLSSLDITKNLKLRNVSFPYNQLKFSTLMWSSNYVFFSGAISPQIIQGGKKGFFEMIDLSSEYIVNNIITEYKWLDKSSNQEVPVYGFNGTFYASPINSGKTLVCHMTNPAHKMKVIYEVTITNNMSETNFSQRTITNIPSEYQLMKSQDTYNQYKDEVIITPNPVIDLVKIQSSSKIEKVLIFDNFGLLKKSIQDHNEISLKELSSGIYIFKIYMKDTHQVFIQKVIKR